MTYQYSGYLAGLLYAPDPHETDQQDAIVFSAADIEGWATRDLPADKEWQRPTAYHRRTPEGVELVGRFEEVRAIDNLAPDDPSFWAPLSTLGWNDPRLPVDLNRYPILEICYRCTSENAVPCLVWTYPGGRHLVRLPCERRWTRLARRIPHYGFPEQAEHLIFRLLSPTRTTESAEIQFIKFRAMTGPEAEASAKDDIRLEAQRPRVFPLLNAFLPMGVVLKVEVARRLSELLGISLSDYWSLVFEDLVRHSHNSLAIEDADLFTLTEWGEFIGHCEQRGLRAAACFNLREDDEPERLDTLLAERVAPMKDSPGLLAWSAAIEPQEEQFEWLMRVKDRFEETDSNHPLAEITRHPSAYPLFSRFLSVSGFSHYTSHAPWEIGPIVRSHAVHNRGQQLWMLGPGFTYATGAPEWSTCPELRLMVNSALANGARGWFTFCYHNDPLWLNGSCQRSLTGPFLAFSDLWLELDKRMERMGAIAPLLLRSQPVPLPSHWFVTGASSDANSQRPEGAPPVSFSRLRGHDFNLYFVISNDVRGMVSVNVEIPTEAMIGLEVYDLYDFVRTHEWTPMDFERHLEMFPGQARIFLVAEPAVCAQWRDEVALRMIEHGRRSAEFNLDLARRYGMDVDTAEMLLESIHQGSPIERLRKMDQCRYMLVDLVYRNAFISDTRSQIIGACAAICACDGVLCRLMNMGRVEQANEWGLKVIPLAREMTQMRIELRHGAQKSLLSNAHTLHTRALNLLSEIRSLV